MNDAVDRASTRPDAVAVLGEHVAHRLPVGIVAAARELAGCPAALYVVDLDGSCLICAHGDDERFPERIMAPLGVGPELGLDVIDELRAILDSKLPGARAEPLLLRDRALGVLVCTATPRQPLQELARQAVLALELTGGYTDVLHAARRHRMPTPAGEIQQNLLPPRISRLDGAALTGGVLPGYDVGGDFFDYAENADGLWLAVADAMGKGNQAAALASLAVGALRAARRGGATLEQVAAAMHDVVACAGDRTAFVTAVLAVWQPGTRVLRWVNCGHPLPLVLGDDGGHRELAAGGTYPLGLYREERAFTPAEVRLGEDERLLLYSDGVTERRDDDGRQVGLAGLVAAAHGAGDGSASRTVRLIQDAVVGASAAPLRDDATLMLLDPRPHRP